MKNSLFIFTPCLPHHSHPVQWDQVKELVCQFLESRPTRAKELFILVPRPFGTTCRCLSVQPFQLLLSRNISKHISLTWSFPPLNMSTPDSPLMLRSCFIDFAVEQRFGCCATEPGECQWNNDMFNNNMLHVQLGQEKIYRGILYLLTLPTSFRILFVMCILYNHKLPLRCGQYEKLKTKWKEALLLYTIGN